MPCSYCGVGGHKLKHCPERLEEKFGTGDDFDDDDKDIRTDGGTARPGWVCNGCGKHVTGTIPVTTCSDCGGRWFEATPDRLACDRCGADDASRVYNSPHNRLCDECIEWENRDDQSDLDDQELVTDGGIEQEPPTDWYCPTCGEHHRTAGDPPNTRCYTCGERTDWQRTRPTDDREIRADGGTVNPGNRPAWNPTTSDTTTAPRCRNCGSQVTRQFARVFGDNRDVVHSCPDCATYREMQTGDAAEAESIDQ